MSLSICQQSVGSSVGNLPVTVAKPCEIITIIANPHKSSKLSAVCQQPFSKSVSSPSANSTKPMEITENHLKSLQIQINRQNVSMCLEHLSPICQQLYNALGNN